MSYKIRTYEDAEQAYLENFAAERHSHLRSGAQLHFHKVFERLFFARNTDTDEDVRGRLRMEAFRVWGVNA